MHCLGATENRRQQQMFGKGGSFSWVSWKGIFTPLPLLLVKLCYENNTRNVLLILNAASRKLPVIPDRLSWEGRKPKSQRKWEMSRECVEGKERKRLKGKQGATRKALLRACLRERKMGAINLESFPGLKPTVTTHLWSGRCCASAGQSWVCFELTTVCLYHVVFSFQFNLWLHCVQST